MASYEESSSEKDVGQAPMPPLDNPELALVLAGVPDSLAQTGDLYAVIINVAVNAWMAGHIHGEDGCTRCTGSRGPAGHDWEARMHTITELQPNITKWFDATCGPAPSTTQATPSPAADVSAQGQAGRHRLAAAVRAGWNASR
ncbi:hypothetical protein [Streptomyces albogriseolus]|uniref:hypothetical protein n=1 Tax=Streptomyces albogriseolus TaxID=1887 RepID=UPI00225C3C0F|nr:hypothetical protein [Streptomyces viridodiastaticus]MCX4624984.1 hypothetical protein [Streptomyces viridodiastaticus]